MTPSVDLAVGHSLVLAGVRPLLVDLVLAADGVGLTRDQWRTGRLVLGVVGLCVLAFVAFRAFGGWWTRRRPPRDR